MAYDDDKYTQALENLAEQIAEQVTEDAEIGYDAEDTVFAIDDIVAVAMSDLNQMVEQRLKVN